MAKIFVSFNIVSTSDFLLVARESDDPIAEVYRSDVLTPPHTVRNITITDINPVMHRVELWTTTDGITLDELRGVCDIDASIINEATFGYIQFVVDRGNEAPEYDPPSGQGQYVNPDLDGLTYLVFKEGFGVLKWGIDIQTIAGGGFEFINGNEFSSEEGYTVQYSLVSTSNGASAGKSYPEDIIEITGDVTFDSTHYNKLIEVNSNATIVTITISNLDAIPNGTKFGINTHNGTQRYVTLQLNTGRYCLINGLQENAVYLGRAEGVDFIKKGSYLRIVGPPPESFTRIGQRVFADGLQPVNTLPETGGWYLKSDYPRPVKWYLERLPAIELGTGTDDLEPDAVNRKKWIIGVNKFWAPDHKEMTYKVAGSGRLANSYQADAVGPANVRTSAWTGQGIGKNGVGGGGVGFLATMGDGGSINSDSASGTNNNNARTDTWPIISSEGETRVKNVATNVYRII